MRTKLPIALATAALAIAVFGPAPWAGAHGVAHAIFAHNADKVDGKNAVGAGASVNNRKGKLVATDSTGRLPTNIVRNAAIDFANIDATSADIDPAVNLATVTLATPSAGYVVVRFEGYGVPSASDVLTVAASNQSASWAVNDGNVSISQPGSFSHTRVYPVSKGTHSFYAVAERLIGTGSGNASVYATLTAEFFATRL